MDKLQRMILMNNFSSSDSWKSLFGIFVKQVMKHMHLEWNFTTNNN